jgi:hypothetical protein
MRIFLNKKKEILVMKEFHETKQKSNLNEKDLAVLDSLAAKTSSSLYM